MWLDKNSKEYQKPQDVPAKTYVTLALTRIEKLISDEKIFPPKGKEFPKNFLKIVKDEIFKYANDALKRALSGNDEVKRLSELLDTEKQTVENLKKENENIKQEISKLQQALEDKTTNASLQKEESEKYEKAMKKVKALEVELEKLKGINSNLEKQLSDEISQPDESDHEDIELPESLKGLNTTNGGRHLAVVHRELETIPVALGVIFGKGVEELDFSWNNIKYGAQIHFLTL